uniref:Uncharacterized protein n=1 Tax=Oryza sativa subsp. indica TaxID=39946 RepID=C5NNZ1_ORYSI|nr:hypothetical protein [Oryza sativa Indica Group]
MGSVVRIYAHPMR